MEQSNYVEVQEEVITPDTTYMCGACYVWFPHIEDFNAHDCPAGGENQTQEKNDRQSSSTAIQDEGDVEKDVANILGEMKYSIPSRASFQSGEAQGGVVQDQTFVVKYEEDPDQHHSISNAEEQRMHYDMETVVDERSDVGSVEIPSSCLFPYENPAYLNRLMKDNTVGKRVRHDAPYIHRLGPWDDVSTKLLIKYVKEVPAAYFIAADNVKRTEAWELIRNKLGEADHHFTVLQIRMRWRELCKKYRNVVNCNEIHGGNRTCQYFSELNDLFGVWTKEGTEILIKELTGKNLKQNGGLRMRFNTWDRIRRTFSEKGYSYTAHQIHGRWNALVMLYQRMVDRNANPDNEPLEMAYKDLIEPMFPYVSSKKRKAKIWDPKEKWNVQMERALLQAYMDNIENFRKNNSKNNRETWTAIVEKLREQGFTTTLEKARTRFYELTKYYSTMLRYNSQPGALHRESKHHEILARIYSQYNFWPHDGSVIKLDNTNARKMRQLNAQLRWSEEESRAVLQLYPQVLTEHLQSAEQQPLEELWVEMAKMLLCVKNIQKLPYEIEEHIVLLRRGFKSDNPFPFRAEMEELEETEHSLCFSPTESPSTDTVQMIPYWSHVAAYTLLDYVIHYRQEGVKTLNDCMYEVISMDLESHGYNYSGKECRQYYLLLRKMFKNKIQSGGDEHKEMSCTFPYWDRMMELKTISHFDYEVDSELCLKILEAASSKIEGVDDDDEATMQLNLERNITQLKIYLMSGNLVRPPPPVKSIAATLLKFMMNEEVVSSIDTNVYFAKLRNLLHPYMSMLTQIAERGAGRYLEKLQLEGKKRLLSKGHKMKAISVQWSDENVQSMLTTVKEWRQLCHDEVELERILGKGHPLWDEVAYNLSRRVKKCPDLCKDYFDMLCCKYIREELGSYQEILPEEELDQSPLQVKNKKLLRDILSPLVAHDAEWDPRDIWRAADTDGWSCEETLELLFTVRELLSEDNAVDWDQVRLMMLAGGFERTSERYQSKFIDLYNGYKRAYVFNKDCLIRARRRPPYYFKIHTLFGFKDAIKGCHIGSWRSHSVNDEVEEEVFESLMAAFKEKKNLFCHIVPRIPLLNSLSVAMNEQYKNQAFRFSPNLIWHLLVQLHNAQADSLSSMDKGPFGSDLDGLWQNHPNPLVAYGLQAVPTSGWQWVKNWSIEELNILIDSVIQQCMPESSRKKDLTKIPNVFLYQLGYMLSTFKHGGYEAFERQLNLVYMLQKWSHIVLDEKNFILQKVRENYRKIEESKAVFRITFNGKSNLANVCDADEFGDDSEFSDELDSFSDSDFDGDQEETDTDDDNVQNTVSALQRNDLSSGCKPVLSTNSENKYGDNVAQKKNGMDTSPMNKNIGCPNSSEVKFVFKVTTTPHLRVGVKAMKPGSDKKSSKLTNSTNYLSVMNPNQEGEEESDLVLSSKRPSKSPNGDGSFSPLQESRKCRDDATSSTPSNKRKHVGEEEMLVKRKKCSKVIETENDHASAQEKIPTRLDIKTAKLTVSARYLLKQCSKTVQKEYLSDSPPSETDQLLANEKVRGGLFKSTETVKKRKRKSQSPLKIEQIQDIGNKSVCMVSSTKIEENFLAQLERHDSEGKEALMELTNQYYKRRKQEKDRLITAFNSVQESHHKQASALLQMFDNLQNLL